MGDNMKHVYHLMMGGQISCKIPGWFLDSSHLSHMNIFSNKDYYNLVTYYNNVQSYVIYKPLVNGELIIKKIFG